MQSLITGNCTLPGEPTDVKVRSSIFVLILFMSISAKWENWDGFHGKLYVVDKEDVLISGVANNWTELLN